MLTIDWDALPPLSPLAPLLLGVDQEADDAEARLLRIVESEPLLGGRIIGAANSTAWGLPGARLSTLVAAVRRLGLRRTIELSTAILFARSFDHRLPVVLSHALWLHALTVAFAAKEIARLKRLREPNAAYLLGLVHDLGFMVMEYLRPGTLDEIVRRMTTENISQEQAEQRAFGVEHQELAAQVLFAWGVPAEVIEPIRRHHALDIEPDSLAAVLFGAEKIARCDEVVSVLYAGLDHPFCPLAMDRIGVEFLFDQQLALASDAVDTLAERVIGQVEALREGARAMLGTH